MGRGKEAQDARPWLARSQEAGPQGNVPQRSLVLFHRVFA